MPPRVPPNTVNINDLSTTGVAEHYMEPVCVDDVAVAGFLNKVGCQVSRRSLVLNYILHAQVFLIDVILDDSYKQILRRYSDFVALRVHALISYLPSLHRVCCRLHWKDSSKIKRGMFYYLNYQVSTLFNICLLLKEVTITHTQASICCFLGFSTEESLFSYLN